MKRTQPHIGQVLRARRNAQGLTLQQVSDVAGIDMSQLSKVERGTCRTNVDTYIRIAAALGWSGVEFWRHAAKVARPAA